MASPDMFLDEKSSESPLAETALPDLFEKAKAQLHEASKLTDEQRRNETHLKKLLEDLKVKMKQLELQLQDANRKIEKLKLKNQILERKLEQCKSFARTLLNGND